MINKFFYFIKYKLLWIRFYYKFIFSHKPLCDRFNNETFFLLKKIYFCRGCFFVYTGIILALALNLLINSKFINCVLFILPVLILFSYPTIYNKFSRLIKDIIRLFSGIAVGQTIMFGIQGHLLYSILIFAVLFLFRNIFNYYRKNNADKACCDCPELIQGQICSGYQQQVAAIRIVDEVFCKNRMSVSRRFEYD